MSQPDAEDEFDLLSAWAAVVRWRYLVGGVMLVGLVGGVALSFKSRPVYESRATIQIGRVSGLGTIQSPAEFVESMNVSGEGGRSSSAAEIADGLVTVTARAPGAEDSRTFLAALLDRVVREHAAIFAEAVASKTRAKKSLTERIAQYERRMQELEERAGELAARNSALAAVMTQDQMRFTSELADLEGRLQVLETELSPITTSPTRVVRQAAIIDESVGRRRLWFPLVGAAVGLLTGLVAAVLLGPRRYDQGLRQS